MVYAGFLGYAVGEPSSALNSNSIGRDGERNGRGRGNLDREARTSTSVGVSSVEISRQLAVSTIILSCEKQGVSSHPDL